jgi:uncharacterized membrane protein
MATIITFIDVNVPVRTAYNQWAQFEDFAHFMEGVKAIHQLDDSHLHWKAEIGGKEQEGDMEITEQTRDQRIAWTSRGGGLNGGNVTFQPLSDAKSTVRLQVGFSHEGVLENVRDGLGLMCFHVQADLGRFKAFIERRHRETIAGQDLRGSHPLVSRVALAEHQPHSI